MRRQSTMRAAACLAAALALIAGCGRGPGRRLLGRWQMDVDATVAEIREHLGEAEAGSPAHALAEAFLAGAEMRQWEYTFRRDGTVRAVVRARPGHVPGLGAGVELQREQGEWEVVEAGEETLTIRITGGERQFADWEKALHFEGDDRLYYYTGPDGAVREYWVRE